MSHLDHWFNLSLWCDCCCLPMNEGKCFFGCLPFHPMLNINKEKHMKTKTKMLDLQSLRTETRVHLDLDLLIFAHHKCANISTIFGRFTLETMYMIWVKAFAAFNPFIIVNIQIDAMFNKELVFQMKWRFGKVMAYNTPPIEKFRFLSLLPIRNRCHSKMRTKIRVKLGCNIGGIMNIELKIPGCLAMWAGKARGRWPCTNWSVWKGQ